MQRAEARLGPAFLGYLFLTRYTAGPLCTWRELCPGGLSGDFLKMMLLREEALKMGLDSWLRELWSLAWRRLCVCVCIMCVQVCICMCVCACVCGGGGGRVAEESRQIAESYLHMSKRRKRHLSSYNSKLRLKVEERRSSLLFFFFLFFPLHKFSKA